MDNIMTGLQNFIKNKIIMWQKNFTMKKDNYDIYNWNIIQLWKGRKCWLCITWMKLGSIMFIEMSQLQKNKLHYILTVVKITEIEGRMAVTSDRE